MRQRERRARRQQAQRAFLASVASAPPFQASPGCSHCLAHQQQIQLLQRLCQLVAARFRRLQSTAAWQDVQSRKQQRLSNNADVVLSDAEAAVQALCGPAMHIHSALLLPCEGCVN